MTLSLRWFRAHHTALLLVGDLDYRLDSLRPPTVVRLVLLALNARNTANVISEKFII